MTRPALIEVEVAYALPELQLILALQLPRGATVQQ
ncbi:MAG: RnfH family protein, partial [Nevskiales bacterium]